MQDVRGVQAWFHPGELLVGACDAFTGLVKPRLVAFVFTVLGLALLAAPPAQAQLAPTGTGATIWSSVCSACHTGPGTSGSGNSDAANYPYLPYEAATSGLDGSCGGGMCSGAPYATLVTDSNAAQNRVDVTYYIANYTDPSVGTVPAQSTAYNTAKTIDITAYVSGWRAANASSSGTQPPTSGGTTLGSIAYGSTDNGNVASFSLASSSGLGTVSGIHADPQADSYYFTYTPYATTSSQTDNLSFSIVGVNGTTVSLSVSIAVGAAPAPTVNDASFTATYEGLNQPFTVGVGAGQPIVGVATGLAFPNGKTTTEGGTITYTSGFGFTYSAPHNKGLTDSITYSATYAGGTVSPYKTITFNITNPGAPVATNPTVGAVAYGSSSNTFSITGAFNASPVVDSYALVSTTTSNGGAVSLTGTTVTYTPASTFTGNDTFQITGSNAAGTNNTNSTVTVPVNTPNPPTLANGNNPTLSLAGTFNEIGLAPTATQLTTVTSAFSGVISNLTLVAALPAQYGTLVPNGNTAFTYTAASGYSGSFTFQVTASNTYHPGTQSPAATIKITVTLPAAPVANSPAPIAVTYVTAQQINLAAIPGAITGGPLNVSNPLAISTAPLHGTATVSGTTVTYTPNALFYNQSDSFYYTVIGPGSSGTPSAPAKVTLNVGSPPPPTAQPQSAAVTYDVAKVINLASAVAGVTTGIAISTAPTHGTATVSGYNVNYTPAASYLGTDSFYYTATGPDASSAPALVSITVTALPTVAPPVVISVPLNVATSFNLANYIAGSGISGAQIVAPPTHGSATVAGTLVTYTPNNNYFGQDTLTYRAFGAGGTATGVITLTIVGRPDPSKDADVQALVTAQAATARHFTEIQIGNFDAHLETLHRHSSSPDQTGASTGTQTGQTPPANPGGNRSAGTSSGQYLASLASDSAPTMGTTAPQTSFVTPTAADPFALAAPVAAFAPGSTPGSPASMAGWQPTAAIPTLGAGAINSVNISSLADGVIGPTGTRFSFWADGVINFGNLETGLNGGGTQFNTEGLSVGADYRVDRDLVVGAGVGYGHDKTYLGTDGSISKGDGTVIVAYASYSPSRDFYLDGMLGLGNLSFDSKRYVEPLNEFANGARSGDQYFFSLTGGYDFHDADLHISPYARLSVSSDQLHQFSETGAAQYDLTYQSESIPSTDGALGVKIQEQHATDTGSINPFVRLEAQHSFAGQPNSDVSYSDLVGGLTYAVNSTAVVRNSYMAAIGVDVFSRHGMTFGIDYEVVRAPGAENSQLLRFKFSQELDEGLAPVLLLPDWAFNRPTGFTADMGYNYDTNVSRNDGADKLADSSINFDLSRPTPIEIQDTLRAIVTPFVGGEKFHTYDGLDQFDYGVRSELQYRPSGEYFSPTLALFAKVYGQDYSDEDRRGWRTVLGVSAREELTDRISLFGALTYDDRQARNAVFTSYADSARVNLDYALSQKSTLYLTGEYRYGDIVSSGAPDLGDLDVAKDSTVDNALSTIGNTRIAYRFKGNTYLTTLGYNLALGERDSLDLSWRYAQSAPLHQPVVTGEVIRYFDNQFGLVYLVRF